VEVHIYTTGSAGKAEKALLAQLEAGEPVMMQVDMGYLLTLTSQRSIILAGHVIVIAGYDATQGQVLAADREGVLYPLALADLARARASQYPPFAPHHKWYTFDFSVFRSRRRTRSGRGHRRNGRRPCCTRPSPTWGCAVSTARQRTLRWPREMDAGALKAACFNVYIMIDVPAAGRRPVRYMYARFLDEAAGSHRRGPPGGCWPELCPGRTIAGKTWPWASERAAQAPDPAQCIEAAGWPLEEESLPWKRAPWAELDGLVRERQSS
jgi:hypothetical protein